jgi:hypothetical protein
VTGVATAAPGKRQVLMPLRGVHADYSLIRADGSTDAFTIDRGRIKEASTTSITIERRDGKSVALGLNSSTKVHGKLEAGRAVAAFSRGGTAFLVRTGSGRAGLPALGRGARARLHGPRGEKPNGDKPSGHKPKGEKPKGDKPKGEKPNGERRLNAAIVHSDLAVTNEKGETTKLTYDLGEIQSVSDSSITVKRKDGPIVTLKRTADTKARGTLEPGRRAVVLSRDGSALGILAGNPTK